MSTLYTHRIRRCNGNRDAWLLVALNDDGAELESFGSYTTALSIDALLRGAGGLLPGPGDVVEIVYYAPDATEDDDACTCATGGAYLCLRCERIAEDQDIGF